MLTLNLNILYTVVNILVLFVLLRKFLYRPVMNVIEQRQKQIDDEIDEMLDKISGSDYTPVSFASADNKDIGLVQFAIRTDDIKK